MGTKIDGGVGLPSNNVETLECSQPPTTSNKLGPADSTNAVVPFCRQSTGETDSAPVSVSGPTFKASELQAYVELCKRAANLPLIGQLGAKHHWLRTPTKEVGMGQTPGQLPGHGEAPPVGLATQWIDHSKETDKECVVIPDIDAACVDRETELGKSTGNWLPLVNDCHTKTQAVLDACSTKPKQTGPTFDDPTKTGAGHSL